MIHVWCIACGAESDVADDAASLSVCPRCRRRYCLHVLPPPAKIATAPARRRPAGRLPTGGTFSGPLLPQRRAGSGRRAEVQSEPVSRSAVADDWLEHPFAWVRRGLGGAMLFLLAVVWLTAWATGQGVAEFQSGGLRVVLGMILVTALLLRSRLIRVALLTAGLLLLALGLWGHTGIEPAAVLGLLGSI